VPAAPDYAPSLAASERRRPPQTATQKNSRRVFFSNPSGRTLDRRHLPLRTAPGYRACGYKTASGRPKWLSRDPLGEYAGINIYGYVLNDPVNGTDQFGLCDADAFIGGLSGGSVASMGGLIAAYYTQQEYSALAQSLPPAAYHQLSRVTVSGDWISKRFLGGTLEYNFAGGLTFYGRAGTPGWDFAINVQLWGDPEIPDLFDATLAAPLGKYGLLALFTGGMNQQGGSSIILGLGFGEPHMDIGGTVNLVTMPLISGGGGEGTGGSGGTCK